jgi:DNA excision repair protein ERCC-3
VGVYVISRIKKNSVIICDSDVSVEQWRDELLRCTTIKHNSIIRLTGKIRDKWVDIDKPVVIITTYHMLSKKREKENEIIQ